MQDDKRSLALIDHNVATPGDEASNAHEEKTGLLAGYQDADSTASYPIWQKPTHHRIASTSGSEEKSYPHITSGLWSSSIRRVVYPALGLSVLLLATLLTYLAIDRPSPSYTYLQTAPASPSNITKTVVLASYDGQNLTWTSEIPKDWTVLRYNIPGREPSTYLRYITDFYDTLPTYTVFLHGHATAWHQQAPAAWKIRALNLTSLDRDGYINFRCDHAFGCTRGNESEAEVETMLGSAHEPPSFEPLHRRVGTITGRFWEKVLEPQGLGPYPEEIGMKCCGQFGVTRGAIRGRSKEFWESLKGPLEDIAGWKPRLGARWREDHAGNVYEYLWHIWFGRPSVDCQEPEVCRNEFFSGAITCEDVEGRRRKQCRNNWDSGTEVDPDGLGWDVDADAWAWIYVTIDDFLYDILVRFQAG